MGNLRAWNNLEGTTLRSVSLRRQRLAEEPVWCGPLGSTTLTVGSEDLSGIEIQVDRDASEKQSS